MLLSYLGIVSPREDGELGDSRSSWHVSWLILTGLPVFASLIVPVLSDKYARRLDVINRGRLYLSLLRIASHLERAGLSGYNTEWAIGVFEQVLAKAGVAHLYPKMQLLIIWFGECSHLSQSQQLILLSPSLL
jgi:hypothetical protein